MCPCVCVCVAILCNIDRVSVLDKSQPDLVFCKISAYLRQPMKSALYQSNTDHVIEKNNVKLHQLNIQLLYTITITHSAILRDKTQQRLQKVD